MRDEPEPYRGPFVVIEPKPQGNFRVSVDPMAGLDLCRHFDGNDEARAYRDLTDHNTARNAADSRSRTPLFSLNRA